MPEGTAPHIVEQQVGEPASYLTVRPGDHVFDLYGWSVGSVIEPRITQTRDEFFDGVVVDFRGRKLFVDAPEVKAIYEGVVMLGVTLADLATSDPAAAPRRATGPAVQDDATALMAAVSRMYVAGRASLADLESDVERVLGAQTCADLDAIAGELLAVPAT
jgi:hypothetical protein